MSAAPPDAFMPAAQHDAKGTGKRSHEDKPPEYYKGFKTRLTCGRCNNNEFNWKKMLKTSEVEGHDVWGEATSCKVVYYCIPCVQAMRCPNLCCGC